MSDPKPNRLEATVSSITTDLLSRAQANDKPAWDHLVDLYGPLVYQWCRQRGLEGQDASDVAQEVFEAVSRNLNSFRRDREGDTFLGWLRTITNSKLHDFWRRSRREPKAMGGSDAQEVMQKIPELGALESDEEVKILFMRILEFARTRFDPTHWHVFWRVVVEEQNPADVAVNLGMERHNVYVIKSRILKTLREVFDDEFNAEDQREDSGRHE